MFIIRPRRKGRFEEKTRKLQDFEEFASYVFHLGDFRIRYQIETPFSEQWYYIFFDITKECF